MLFDVGCQLFNQIPTVLLRIFAEQNLPRKHTISCNVHQFSNKVSVITNNAQLLECHAWMILDCANNKKHFVYSLIQVRDDADLIIAIKNTVKKV